MADRASADEIVFLPLGGIGEIGMNCYLYGQGPEDRRQWLMVDLGITFPEGEFDPGVDVILPDIRFIAQERKALAGIVLTHAHEDHFGAVIELWPRLHAPVYATPFTAALLRAKLAEFGAREEIEIIEVALNTRFKVGPFDLEMISVAHFDPRAQRARAAHAAGPRAAYGRLEKSTIRPTSASRSTSSASRRSARKVCSP